MFNFQRVVVIAPTRSTCVNIQVVLSNGTIPPTLLMQEKGNEIRDAIANLDRGGFGIVAGTGTGKTVGIRDIAKAVLGAELSVDVVTREHEATDKTWKCNTLVVTPGVAVHWLVNGVIGKSDLIVLDEVHQTSEHLELAMALAKRAGCTFVFLSATVDPTQYAQYLNARTVIECSAFDPAKRSEVYEYRSGDLQAFLKNRVNNWIGQQRAVAVFVPTREMAESMAREFGTMKGLHADFYHGGESADKLRAFLKGEVPKPFMIFMTTAGASSLNILGLDIVVILDEMFRDVIHSGVKTLERVELGNNELLQMGGRVNGRTAGSEIHILTARWDAINFHALKPNTPAFVLGGDLKRVALTCARIGISAADLDLIGHIDHEQYRGEVARFRKRKIIEQQNDDLTPYGRKVEQLPVDPDWAEMLVAVHDLYERVRDDKTKNPKELNGAYRLLLTTIVASCVEQLYGLVTKQCHVMTDDAYVHGSDHLTAANIVMEALRKWGYIHTNGNGAEYKFRGDWVKGPKGASQQMGEFSKWCHDRGFNRKAIREVAIALRSVFRQLRMPLPDTHHYEKIEKQGAGRDLFVMTLARVQSLDFTQGAQNSQVGTVFPSKDGVSQGWYRLGRVRRWKDAKGYMRASMEGTDIPPELVWKYGNPTLQEIVKMSDDGERIVVRLVGEFAGEPIGPQDVELSPSQLPSEWQLRAAEMFHGWLADRML